MRGSASVLWIIGDRPPGAAMRHMKRAHASNASSGIWCAAGLEPASRCRASAFLMVGRVGENDCKTFGRDACLVERA